MPTFVKGYELENGVVVLEGAGIKVCSVQGEIFEGTLVSAAKKKVEIQIAGELETRLFSLDILSSMETA